MFTKRAPGVLAGGAGCGRFRYKAPLYSALPYRPHPAPPASTPGGTLRKHPPDPTQSSSQIATRARRLSGSPNLRSRLDAQDEVIRIEGLPSSTLLRPAPSIPPAGSSMCIRGARGEAVEDDAADLREAQPLRLRRFRPRLEAYLDTLQGYRKNQLPPLAPKYART